LTLPSIRTVGLGTFAVEDDVQAGFKFDYDPSADNSFAGFDRFGHLYNLSWIKHDSQGNVSVSIRESLA
jgi:hypothetical protein